ncbi:MAG: DUF599 domain-containing protein [Alphaproteobacteria bacterium]|nr:MAG: DUF599 domain-containing protein [Alphaproteobacteria bacterium]
MPGLDLLFPFGPLDGLALGLLLAAWAGIGWHIEHPPAARPSVHRLMMRYRREWMVEMVTRQPRIFDSSVLAILREGTSFFASATMIAIGGGLALVGDPSRIAVIAEDLGQGAAPDIVWREKLLLSILLLVSAFLNFVWSHRVFGYCAVVMASVPNDPHHPAALPRAAKAADLNITAARSFNRGVRGVYFAMAALAWLAGPLPLIAATAFTVVVLWRREFASQSRLVALRPDEGADAGGSGSKGRG